MAGRVSSQFLCTDILLCETWGGVGAGAGIVQTQESVVNDSRYKRDGDTQAHDSLEGPACWEKPHKWTERRNPASHSSVLVNEMKRSVPSVRRYDIQETILLRQCEA